MQRASPPKVTPADPARETTLYQSFVRMIGVLLLAGCTLDPSAPVNRSFPVLQLDRFFGSPSAAPAAADPTHEPGYAPAYPPD